jgi:hypothetical protein
MDEGKDQKAALGQCEGMWREHAKASTATSNTFTAFADAFAKVRAKKGEG